MRLKAIAYIIVIALFLVSFTDTSPVRTFEFICADSTSDIRRVSLIFGGDVMQHMPQVESARRDTTFDYSGCFKYLQPIFDTTDIVILNLETTINDKGRYSGYPMFASPPHLVEALKECGTDILVLANNHTADRGYYGLGTTIETVRKKGLPYTGAFRDSVDYRENNPLMFERNGIRLALMNYTYDLNGMPMPRPGIVNLIDTMAMAGDIERADEMGADIKIIFIHWGEEYMRRPSAQQRFLSEWCRAKGVNFIIGSHPHVVQSLEVYSDSMGVFDGLTAFSLGNLVSNQRKRYTDGGMLVRIDMEMDDTGIVSVDPSFILTWVHTPSVNGSKQYIILPSFVADTLLRDDPAAKRNYEKFMSDSRELLSPELEWKSPITGDN